MIKTLLEANNLKFINDKKVKYRCYQQRPDFVINFGLFAIIIECNENQHKSYACECEQSRIIAIFQDFGGMQIVFIRYNPDNYIDNMGIKKLALRNKFMSHLSFICNLFML